MTRYTFELATGRDGGQIRELLNHAPMEGGVSLCFKKEPDYFAAARTEGLFTQTIVARDQTQKQIVGVASRSIKPAFINGRVESVGYLGGLRIRPEHRNRLILARGYRFLKQLHADKRAGFYLTTIMSDNKPAGNILTSSRAGLPVYHGCGRLLTYAFSKMDGARSQERALSVRRAAEQDADQVVEMLYQAGGEKQFFPYLTKDQLLKPNAYLRGVRIENFFMAFSGRHLAGVCAFWDQRAFKQILVHAYQGFVKTARPVYNIWAGLRGCPGLPPPGKQLDVLYMSFVAIPGNHPWVFRALLRAGLESCRKTDKDFILAGLHERDSLNESLRRSPHLRFDSRLFVAAWNDGDHAVRRLDSRIPYVEIASL